LPLLPVISQIGTSDLTDSRIQPSIFCMTEHKAAISVDSQLARLENRLNELLEACETLKRENARLRDENAVLVSERGLLLSNRDKVRSQVEAMISRLKAMEAG